MDVMQIIRLYDAGLWDLLFSGFKIRPEQEKKITLNQYQSLIMRNPNYVKQIIKEGRNASFTERGLIAYVLTVCDYADVAQEFFPEYLRVINFFDDYQRTILVELICYHHRRLNPLFNDEIGRRLELRSNECQD